MNIFSFNRKWILFCLSIVLLAGCGPHTVDYQVTPAVQASSHFSMAGGDTGLTEKWWQAFNRPELDELIEQALQTNQNLAQAVARIKQARSVTRQTESGRYPHINLESNITARDPGYDNKSLDISGTFDWEVDIFNRIDSLAEAGRLTELARIEDAKSIRLSLCAEVATVYFSAVAARRGLELLQQQVQADNQVLSLLKLQFESGLGTNVAVLQQQSRVADSRSLIPLVLLDLRIYENRLDVLVGQIPDGHGRVATTDSLEISSLLPAVGVPSDLLVKRPDVRSARAELIAADADIAAAIADRLPRITLDGSYLYSDAAAINGPLAIITGTFIQPLLDWGQRKAEVARNQAVYEERLAVFSQAYLQAVEDVENSLYREQQQREFIVRLIERKNILQQTVTETEARYAHGLDDYLPVLSALQELRNIERSLVTQQLALVVNRVELHRAIGGGGTQNLEPIDNEENL